jgi:hypothetical protein
LWYFFSISFFFFFLSLTLLKLAFCALGLATMVLDYGESLDKLEDYDGSLPVLEEEELVTLSESDESSLESEPFDELSESSSWLCCFELQN